MEIDNKFDLDKIQKNKRSFDALFLNALLGSL